MTDSDFASRQLRDIRSLMERATIYRSISAPTALVGGLLSLVGFAIAYYAEQRRNHPLSSGEFLLVWFVILALTCSSNLIFLSRDSIRRGEPFFSSGMKCALTSVGPAFFLAGLVTLLLHRPIDLALLWMTLYGLGLLATQHFAPRSLVLLGLMFFLSGCTLLGWRHFFIPSPNQDASTPAVSAIMAATFGGYHLAYAATVWALGEDRTESVSSTRTENV